MTTTTIPDVSLPDGAVYADVWEDGECVIVGPDRGIADHLSRRPQGVRR